MGVCNSATTLVADLCIWDPFPQFLCLWRHKHCILLHTIASQKELCGNKYFSSVDELIIINCMKKVIGTCVLRTGFTICKQNLLTLKWPHFGCM